MISATDLLHRTRRALNEMDYAQRRLLEIRTGVPQTPSRGARRRAQGMHELERLWSLGPHRG